MHFKTICWLMSAALLSGCSSNKSQFVDGCVDGGATKALCSCAYDKLEQRYSPDIMVEALHINSPSEMHQKLPPDFYDSMISSVQQCANQ